VITTDKPFWRPITLPREFSPSRIRKCVAVRDSTGPERPMVKSRGTDGDAIANSGIEARPVGGTTRTLADARRRCGEQLEQKAWEIRAIARHLGELFA
jgi:hypothetical protein